MYVVRNVFQARPLCAGQLVARFKAAAPILEELGHGRMRVLTDIVAGFWTVVVEAEVEDLGRHLDASRTVTSDDRLREIMSGYTDLVAGGRREVFKIE